MRRTKIIATLGPATESKAVIQQLAEAGLNVARLNFSHGTYDQFKSIAKNVRAVEKKSGKLISLMQDLQGPKIRLGKMPEGSMAKRGSTLTLCTKKEEGCVHVPYPALPKVVKKGDALLIEDGLIRTKVLSKRGNKVKVKVLQGGELKSHKGVNIPDSSLPASASLTAKDRKDLEFGIKTLKVDWVAVSFVEGADDILRVRKAIQKHSKRKVGIIAKIERKEALKHLDEIIEAADGVMVARGDLGIETAAEQVPIVQRRIVQLAREQGKPVIIATQILQSMVDNALPTRAEVSDAATAIFELADAVMLSNETAVGKHPIKAVQTLAKVSKSTEGAIFKEIDLSPTALSQMPGKLQDESIALNACYLAEHINAKAIIIATKMGYTASMVLKHRPETPVIVVTEQANTAHQINLHWGTETILVKKGLRRSEELKNELVKKKLIKKGDDVVIVKLSDHKRSLVVMAA